MLERQKNSTKRDINEISCAGIANFVVHTVFDQNGEFIEKEKAGMLFDTTVLSILKTDKWR